EQLAEAAEAGKHPALDRTQGLSEAVSELRLREPAVVGELDRLALLVRKASERLLDSLPLEAEPDRLVGRGARAGRLLERLGPPAFLAPDEVDRAPVHERQQPRARLRALRDEARRAAPRGEEALLDGVLG